MHKIREWLYIGKYSQTRDLDYLNLVGITAMLQLAEHVPQPDIDTLYLDVNDGEAIPHEMIEHGINYILEKKKTNNKVLVACGAGISRSSTFALAALMEAENLSLFEAYHEVFLRHRGAEPHHELIMSLSAYHGEVMDLAEAWKGLRAVRQSIKEKPESKPH